MEQGVVLRFPNFAIQRNRSLFRFRNSLLVLFVPAIAKIDTMRLLRGIPCTDRHLRVKNKRIGGDQG